VTERADLAGRTDVTGRRDVTGRVNEAEMPQGRTMPLREKELRAQRTTERIGEVDVYREVREEKRTIEVPVTREEVVIHTRPASGEATGPISEGEVLRIPVSEERVTITKEPHVYGEVDIETQRTTEQRPFTETVRKEVSRIERKGQDKEHVVEDKINEPAALNRDRDALNREHNLKDQPLDRDRDRKEREL
jgi:uncharacterized protein (TIGR02271 family)